MAATTPHMKDIDLLEPLASRYVDVESLPWKPTPSEGIDMKVLLEDKETGLLTALFRWQPGAHLALHEHVEIEQTYVLEGSIEDVEGTVSAGDFVWRPTGNRHDAWSTGRRPRPRLLPQAEQVPRGTARRDAARMTPPGPTIWGTGVSRLVGNRNDAQLPRRPAGGERVTICHARADPGGGATRGLPDRAEGDPRRRQGRASSRRSPRPG